MYMIILQYSLDELQHYYLVMVSVSSARGLSLSHLNGDHVKLQLAERNQWPRLRLLSPLRPGPAEPRAPVPAGV